MSTETVNIVSSPTPGDIGETPSSLMSLFSDTKHIIHVAIEIIVLGALFYYSKSSNSALKSGIDLLQEEVDEQKDQIDQLKSTVTHLTDAITKLTGVIEKFKIPPPQRQTFLSVPQPVQVASQPVTPAPVEVASQPVTPAPVEVASQPVTPAPVEVTPAPKKTSLETIQEFSTPGAASIDDEIEDELSSLE
jgi:cell division septation protein DedD